MLPYTVFLGAVIVYWLIVILGILDIDALDFGDFDLEGVGEGAAEGAAEALGEGEVSTESSGSTGALHSLLNFLNLGKVPITVILSFVALKMWILAYLYSYFLAGKMGTIIPGFLLGGFLFVGFLFFSLLLTGLTTRPLRKIFQHATTHGQQNLLGKICKIKTTEVTAEFGQAQLKIDSSFLLLSVRCKEGVEFSKGDEAIITGYNKEKDVYEVKKI